MIYSLSLAEPDPTLAVPVVLAQPSPSPEEPRGEDVGKSSPVGFLVLILFFIAVAFLVRSMNKHLKRVPATFDKPEVKPDTEPAAEPEKPQDANGKPGSA